MSTEIAQRLRSDEHLHQRLETIPGIKRRLAEVILAEIGSDMVRRIGGSQGVQLKLLGLLEKPMRTYLIPAQVA